MDGVGRLLQHRRSWRVLATIVATLVLAPITSLLSATPVFAWSATLQAGQSLSDNQSLVSPNGDSHLDMQSDGNLVLYTMQGQWLWQTYTHDTAGTVVFMQGDGNLVLRDIPTGNAIWNSSTGGHPNSAYYLSLQNDDNLVIYGPSGSIWSTNTYKTYVPMASGHLTHQDKATFVYEVGGVPMGFADNSSEGVDYQTIYWATQNKYYVVWYTDYMWNDVTNGKTQAQAVGVTVAATEGHDHIEWYDFPSSSFTRYSLSPAQGTYWNTCCWSANNSVVSAMVSQNDAYWNGGIQVNPGGTPQGPACCYQSNSSVPWVARYGNHP